MELHAWLQMWPTWARPKSKASYLAHGGLFGAVYPMDGGACDASGTWVQYSYMHDAEIKQQTRLWGQWYMPMVWATSGAAFQAVLDDEETWQNAIDNLVVLAATRAHDGPWDGVMFDIENVSDTYRQQYTDWMGQASGRLHDAGLHVGITASVGDCAEGPQWWQRTFDHAALSEIADVYATMHYHSYGMNPDTAPGPYALLDRELAWVSGRVTDKAKLLAGLALCPRYIQPDRADLISHTYAEGVLDTFDAPLRWYELGNDRQRFRFKRAAWTGSEMWMVDADTFKLHLNLIGEHGIGGACLFVPGGEDEAIWQMLADWKATPVQNWHGYVAIENLDLSADSWTAFVNCVFAQGRKVDGQPARVTHWRTIDANRLVVEAYWLRGELSTEHWKDWLGAVLDADTAGISASFTQDGQTEIVTFSAGGIDYLRLRIFAPGALWMGSGNECRRYLAAL